MHPDPSHTPHPVPHTPVPAGHTARSQATWDLAKRDYLAGQSRTQVCDRYGLSPSTFDDRARRQGWRKCDQPDPPPIPDDDPEADEPVDCASLAEDALARVRRALRLGRASEAASWMRLHDRLTARLEALEERVRRRDRVAVVRGSEVAVHAMAALRDRLDIIARAAGNEIRLSRAHRSGGLLMDDYCRLAGLNDRAVATLKTIIAAEEDAAAAVAQPACSHPDFSGAPDP